MVILLHSFHPSPVLAIVGPFVLRWYGFFLAVGAISAYAISRALARRYRLPEEHVWSLFLANIIAGLVGARLYHVLNELPYYLNDPAEIVQVWHGGLAIHGALIAGFFTTVWYCRRHRLALWRIADLFAPGLLLAQGLGRWGNYFNQELFGGPTALPWGIPIDPANRPPSVADAAYFHPTFAYEFVWDVLAAGGLLLMHRARLHGAKIPDGVITMLYLTSYALGRLLTELLRIDAVPIVGGIRLPLLVSVVLLLLSWYGAVVFWRRSRSRTSSA